MPRGSRRSEGLCPDVAAEFQVSKRLQRSQTSYADAEIEHTARIRRGRLFG